MIKRDISLYNIDDFHIYVNQQVALGNRVLSVTNYVKNEDIARLVPFLDIIDLSAYLGIDLGTQALFEQLIPLYPTGINLIADVKYENEVREKLRFLIDTIHYIDIGGGSKKNPTDNPYKDVNRIVDLTPEGLDVFMTSFDVKLYGHEKFKKEFHNLVNTFRVFNKIGEHKISFVIPYGRIWYWQKLKWQELYTNAWGENVNLQKSISVIIVARMP